jgi:hypothetical protein
VSFSEAHCMLIIKHYQMQCSYLACQTDFVHKFTAPVKSTLFSIKYFCGAGSVND